MPKPRKLNARQRRFALKVAAGKPASTAYVEAGYKPDIGHASRLASNGIVAQAIEDLLATVSIDELRSLERVVADHERTFRAAFEAGQFAAANAAKIAIGKTSGLYHDRVYIAPIELESSGRLINAIAGDDPKKRAAAQELLEAPDDFDESIE